MNINITKLNFNAQLLLLFLFLLISGPKPKRDYNRTTLDELHPHKSTKKLSDTKSSILSKKVTPKGS